MPSGFPVPDAARCAQLFDGCCAQTRAFAQGCGFSDAVVGLSGGIDSALVAAMAVRAFGAGHVHGVLMPGPYSSASSVMDAQELACGLGIPCSVVDIGDAYRAFMGTLAPACDGEPSDLTSQNIQARCRMVVLMALSNQHGWMVLNTGNKTEACVGYSTLHGDMVGAFAPIGGLYKAEVFALSRWLNDSAHAQGLPDAIPQAIIDKRPSAELTAGQTDEASLGIGYASLDAILRAHVEDGLGRDALLEEGFDQAEVERVLRLYAAAEWKRRYEPPCAVV